MKHDRLVTEQSLAAKERELAVAKTTFPFNAKTIITLQNEVDGLTRGIDAIDDLAEELGLRDQDLNNLEFEDAGIVL